MIAHFTSRYPSSLVIPFCAVSAGIVWQAYALPLILPGITLTLLVLPSMWRCDPYPSKKLFSYFIYSLLFLVGSWRYGHYEYAHVAFNRHYAGKPFTLMGEVKENRLYERKKFQQCLIITLHTLNEEVLPFVFCGQNIKVWLKQPVQVDSGDRIHCSQLMHYPSQEKQQRLLHDGCIGSARASLHNHLQIFPASFSLQRWLTTRKNAMRAYFQSQMSPLTFSLFDTLFLGFKQPDNNGVRFKQQFQYWGIVHYLARSGLHLVMVSFLLKGILRYIPLPYAIKHILMVLFILIYALLTKASTSFIRALIFFSLYSACALFTLAAHQLHIVVLTGLILIIINPCALFFLDFQLSFALTLCIAFFAHNKNIQQKQ
jgi:ComEC/Rec2-related protein